MTEVDNAVLRITQVFRQKQHLDFTISSLIEILVDNVETADNTLLLYLHLLTNSLVNLGK